ncbi:hypothetical protein QBC38DRAFT_283366 [Podospora fimiseda]|uniref:F-box domain-containing protein n=1 Tax=Podospora fimiseda TaxID=252190 RepID=A0AAN7BKG5_9PEZI|nr:hypothetical protein QBC38DRAFT_283366 [Podospora fimiseda]
MITHPQIQVHPTTCHLLHLLPLELRQLIFSFLNILHLISYPNPKSRWYTPPSTSISTPPIAKTCRQLRYEILSICLRTHPLHVEIWDIYPLDIEYLKRWLNNLGDNILLAKELIIHHKVEFYLRRLMRSFGHEYVTTCWAKTSFCVQGDGEVIVRCDFLTEENKGDEFLVGRICRCPVENRLVGQCGLGLTHAVYGFIELMEEESAGSEVDWHGSKSLRENTEENWPFCGCCGFKRWFLSGPKSDGVVEFVDGKYEEQCKAI